MIAVLEEMRAQIALSGVQSRIDRERLEEIDQRIEKMRELHEQEKALVGKAYRNAS